MNIERKRQILLQVNGLPTLPKVMSKLIEISDNPNTTAPQLANFLSNDPVLTTRILRIANSSFYGFPQKIGTINLAIVVLGFQSIKDLGLSATVSELFQGREYTSTIDKTKFWLHSIASAAACRIMSRECGFNSPGEVFITGLLHDIGLLVLSKQTHDEYKKVISNALENGKGIFETEEKLLGFNHADLSGWLLENWKIPPCQVAAIYHNYTPWNCEEKPNLSMLVNFSDILAQRNGYSIFPNIPDFEGTLKVDERVINYLNLRLDENGDVDWNYYNNLLKLDITMMYEFY